MNRTKINKHGLKMNGLKQASGETVNWVPCSGGYTEIFYNMENGNIWTIDQVSLGENSWTVYHNPDVIKICNTSSHMTMQSIADCIARKVEETERARKLWKQYAQ